MSITQVAPELRQALTSWLYCPIFVLSSVPLEVGPVAAVADPLRFRLLIKNCHVTARSE